MAAAHPALPLDGGKIKKAAHALLAYNKTRQKTAETLLLHEDQNIFLMVTVWKIPPREQVVKITLPHGILPATSEVCLFTKDEPGLTAEQTENLYRKLLSQHGVTNVAEVISYKTLTKEYKSFEAKRRLLSRFSLFLSDDRVRRLLPSHIGKHFYRSKKAPLSVNLRAKNLAKELNRHIQGTVLPVTNKGCCYTARVGHTGMTAEQIAGNVMAVAMALAGKAPKISKSIKILHLKTEKSVALPIFHWSCPSSEDVQKKSGTEQRKKNKKKNQKNKSREQTPVKPMAEGSTALAVRCQKGAEEETAEASDAARPEQEDDEEIPLLVPIETVAETSPANKGVEMNAKVRSPGKRKLTLSSEASIAGLEIPKGGSSPKTPKPLKPVKKIKAPKQLGVEKELAKTPLKPKTRSSMNPRRKKAIMSAKKAPRTPKQTLGERELLQSV